MKRKQKFAVRSSKRIKTKFDVPYLETSSLSPVSTISDSIIDSQMAGTAAGFIGLAAGGPVVGDAAAQIGTIAGGLYGMRSFAGLSSIKRMGGQQRNIRARNDKSAMSTSGKAKVKRAKSVKVSTYLKKAVKQVMQGASATGIYKRCFSGNIGNAFNVVVGAVDGTLDMSVYGTSVPVVLLPSVSKSPNQKTWFGALCQTQFADNSVAITNTDLNFFTPGKIWHMASVLFNNKTDNPNPYATTTDNLAATFIQDTGAPAPTSQNLKITVKSSSAVLTMRNMSARVQFVDVYECVSTTKFQATAPLNACVELAKSLQDGTDAGEQNSIVNYNLGATKFDAQRNSFLSEGSVDAVSILKSNGLKWKYKKHSMMLAPGEMCTHTVVGPSGVLDFQKLWDPISNTYNTNCCVKDWSKHLMISVRPDFIMRATETNRGQRFVLQDTAKPSLMSGIIAVEVVENLSIVVPEVAGFVGRTAAAATGVGQPLNMRRNRMVINTITPAVGFLAASSFVYSTEQNPVQTISSNSFV